MKPEMRLLFLLFCLAFSLSFLYPASTASFKLKGIQGIIYDQESNPIVGATVVLYNENSSLVDYTISREDGFFCFQPEAGHYFIVVSCSGYNPKRSSMFHFDEKSTIEVDVVLLKKPESLSEKLSDFWSNFGGLITIGVSLFTFWLGIYTEEKRSKRERMKKIKSSVSIPLSIIVSSVLKNVKNLESAVKTFVGPRLDNEMNKILKSLKSDFSKLENKLQGILLDNELLSYLPMKKVEEYREIWETFSWFSEWLKNDIGVLRASIKKYFRSEADPNRDKLENLFGSFEKLK